MYRDSGREPPLNHSSGRDKGVEEEARTRQPAVKTGALLELYQRGPLLHALQVAVIERVSMGVRHTAAANAATLHTLQATYSTYVHIW